MKRNGAIGGAQRGWFACYEYGNDDCLLPDGGDVCPGQGQVKEGAEVGNACGTQVFKVEDGQGRGQWSCRRPLWLRGPGQG